MEHIAETDISPGMKESKYLLEQLKTLIQKKHLLVKRGKILNRQVFRYFCLHKQNLVYYRSLRSEFSSVPVNLTKAIAVPSSFKRYRYAIKVNTHNFQKKFYILPESYQEQVLFMMYLKFASNGQVSQVLKEDSNYSTSELRLFEDISSPVKEKSPSPLESEEEIETPEENQAQVVPITNMRPASLNVTKSLVAEEKESYCQTTREKTPDFAFFERKQSGFKLPPVQTPESIRQTGLNYLLNFKLENAKRCFSVMKHCDLRCSLHFAEVSMFRVLVTGRKSDVVSCTEAISEVERTLCNLSEKHSEVIMAETNLFKSILLLLSGQKLKAFITLRQAWKLYKKFENRLERVEDLDIRGRVLFGLGLFMLFLSLVPSSMSTLLKLIGFSGSREKGVEFLEACKDTKTSRSVFAAVTLGLYHIDMEPNIEKSSYLLSQAAEEYPGCVLVHWVYSVVAWKNNHVDSAVQKLHQALDCCGETLAPLAAFIKYELGWFYFLRMEWKKAQIQFSEILGDSLSLSSELDEYVKEALAHGKIAEHREASFETLFMRRLSSKKKTKPGWTECSQPKNDRVFIPHKACLIAQLAGCFAAQNLDNLEFWLKVCKIAAFTPSASKTKLDEDFGSLAQVFLNREHRELLPFEVIYFLKQHTKLVSWMLDWILDKAEEVLEKVSNNNDFLVEFCSAKMLQIMALSLDGSTDEASEIADEMPSYLYRLPSWGVYLAPHTLYWSARAYVAELRYEDAVRVLKQAKKYKKYIFNIRGKISRVMQDTLKLM